MGCSGHNQRTWSFLDARQVKDQHKTSAKLRHTCCFLCRIWSAQQSVTLLTVWIPPQPFPFITQRDSRLCLQWTRCEKLPQYLFYVHSWKSYEMQTWSSYLWSRQIFSLIPSNKFYHVCTQGPPALHQLTAASVFPGSLEGSWETWQRNETFNLQSITEL